MQSKKFITASLIVGECPIYNHLDDRIYYLDIRGKCFYSASIDGKVLSKTDLPQQIGCMAFCKNGDLLLGMEDGVYRLDSKGQIKLAHQPIKIKGRRFNDGKVGYDGAYYLGTTDNDGEGAFYQLKDGVLTELFDNVKCSNGIDWSIDGRILYYVDSPVKKIEAFDFDALKSNPLSNRRTICDLTDQAPEKVVPDGMCIDADGNLWVAMWGGGKVLKVNERNGVVDEIKVGVNKPSSCAFVGKNYDKLLITSASYEEKDVNAGSLYIAKPKAKGLKINLYKW